MTAVEILHKYKIRNTAIREEILTILINAKQSLTCADMIRLVRSTNSRASILRTLKYYKLKGIIRYFMSTSRKLQYHFTEEDNDQNVYFTCNKCQKSFRLNLEESSPIDLPANLNVEKIVYIVSGTCPCCSEK